MKISIKKGLRIVTDTTLQEWLEMMEKHPDNVSFDDFQFPTDEIKEQFLSSIFSYSEDIISNILESFLIPTGTLASDISQLEHYHYLQEEHPEQAQFAKEKDHYYQRLLAYEASDGDNPVWEGITWILHIPRRKALDVLQAFTDAHFRHLPDGRYTGLHDAMAILRTRYFTTDNNIAASVLYSLEPIDLEYLVEYLYREMGYTTEITQLTHDGGIDVIATKDEPGKKEKNLIQCKKW